MKKYLSLVLILSVLFVLSGCISIEIGGGDDDEDTEISETKDDMDREGNNDDDEEDEDEDEKMDNDDDEDEEEGDPDDGYGGPDLEAELVEKNQEIAELKEKVEELEEEITYDGDNFITVIEPKQGAGFYNEPIEFEGKVSPNTEKVVVTATMAEDPYGPLNDEYELQDFKLGDEEFTYRAKREYGNLEAGKVYYEFEAYYDDGSTDVVGVEIEFQSEGIPPEPYVVIDSPANNDIFYEDDVIEFRGHVPINTTKIEVEANIGHAACIEGMENCTPAHKDVYTLTKFKHGDKNFTYRASRKWKNLGWADNTYTFRAYNDEGKVAETTLTIYYYAR